jgi:hypothetical protein
LNTKILQKHDDALDSIHHFSSFKNFPNNLSEMKSILSLICLMMLGALAENQKVYQLEGPKRQKYDAKKCKVFGSDGVIPWGTTLRSGEAICNPAEEEALRFHNNHFQFFGMDQKSKWDSKDKVIRPSFVRFTEADGVHVVEQKNGKESAKHFIRMKGSEVPKRYLGKKDLNWNLIFQNDGNLVLYVRCKKEKVNHPVWSLFRYFGDEKREEVIQKVASSCGVAVPKKPATPKPAAAKPAAPKPAAPKPTAPKPPAPKDKSGRPTAPRRS